MWNLLTDTFRNYFRFSGRADRKEFWTWSFAILAVSIVLVGILAALAALLSQSGNTSNPIVSGIFSAIITLAGLFWLVMFIPSLTVSVRRLRDAAISPWLLLIPAVPGILTFLVLLDRGLSNMDGNPSQYPDSLVYILTTVTVVTGIVFLVLFCKPSKKV